MGMGAVVLWFLSAGETRKKVRMRGLLFLAVLGLIVGFLQCSAELEAPTEGAPETSAIESEDNAEENKNIFQEMIGYISPGAEEEDAAAVNEVEDVEDFNDEKFGVIGSFFEKMSGLVPRF